MILTKQQKLLVYPLLCITIRSIPIFTLSYTVKFNLVISLLYLFMGINFLLKATTYTKNQLGVFGGKIWWQNLRIFHGLCYLLVYYIISKYKPSKAVILLIFDLLIGIYYFMKQYS